MKEFWKFDRDIHKTRTFCLSHNFFFIYLVVIVLYIILLFWTCFFLKYFTLEPQFCVENNSEDTGVQVISWGKDLNSRRDKQNFLCFLTFSFFLKADELLYNFWNVAQNGHRPTLATVNLQTAATLYEFFNCLLLLL